MSQWVAVVAAVLCACAVLMWPGGSAPWHLRRSTSKRSTSAVDGHAADLPEVFDHVALALRGGAGLQPALRHVAAATPGDAGVELAAVAAAMAWGVDDEAAWSNAPPRWQPAQRALVLAARGGVAPSELLSAAALDMRRDVLARVENETARLSVRLVLPLGLAFLPAFILTTVVPVVVSLAGSVLEVSQ